MTWEKVLVVIVMGAAFYFILTGLGLVAGAFTLSSTQ